MSNAPSWRVLRARGGIDKKVPGQSNIIAQGQRDTLDLYIAALPPHRVRHTMSAFFHHPNCKVIHTGSCFPIKHGPFTPVSRQETFKPSLPLQERPIQDYKAPKSYDNPKEATETHVSKGCSQCHLNKEEGHNGSWEHIPGITDECGCTDSHVGRTCSGDVECYSENGRRHPNHRPHYANQRTAVESNTFHSWSQRDDHGSHGKQ